MAEIKLTGEFSFKCDLCTSKNVLSPDKVNFNLIEEKAEPMGLERTYQWSDNYECRCTKEFEIDYRVTEYPPGVHDTDSISISEDIILSRFECDFSENVKPGTIGAAVQQASQPFFTPEEYENICTAVLDNELYVIGNIFYEKLISENELSSSMKDKWKTKIQSGEFADKWYLFIDKSSPSEQRLLINASYNSIIAALDKGLENEGN